MTRDLRLKIEHVPPGAIRRGNRALRRHDEAAIGRLMRSVERFGMVAPLIVDAELALIDGHGLLEAAQRLGFEDVPVVRLAHLSEADRRVLSMTLNKLAEDAQWDEDALRIEFETILELDPEIDLTLSGFELPQIDTIMFGADADDAADPDDALPDEDGQHVVSRAGDLWRIGDHRLICGDARDGAVMARLLDGETARVVITDPPWNVPITGHVGNSGATQHAEFAMASGEMSDEEFARFLAEVMAPMAEALCPSGLMFVFIDWRSAGLVLETGRALDLSLENLIVWNKTNAGMGSLYRSKHELVPLFKKPGGPHVNNVQLGSNGRYRTNVWDYAGSNTFGADRMERLRAHPTTKPSRMLSDALLDVTERGDVVLDSFCGSGSILIAAERVDRRARAIEIDPVYVDRALRRFEARFGVEAVLAETGQRFSEVAGARHAEPSVASTPEDLSPLRSIRKRTRPRTAVAAQ